MEGLLIEILHLTSKELQDAKQIYHFTQDMQRSIEQEDVDGLTQAIALRQKWMEQAEDSSRKIQERLKKFQGQYSVQDLEELGNHPQAQGILENRAKKKEIYKTTFELENKNQEGLKKLLEKYKVSIMGIQQGKEAFLKYGKNKSANQSIMINRLK